jgi:lipoate-protein ligase A
MAADEVLLESAQAGVSSFRLYGWSEATVSLGYFQPAHLRKANSRVSALPFVRRPSGGAALVHHREVTYALALPAGSPWQGGESWLCRMHTILNAALASLGVIAMCCGQGPKGHVASLLCFQDFTPGDLLIGHYKVAGSAQRRQKGALMQHGGILLGTSPYAPELPGINELTGRALGAEEFSLAVVKEFARLTGWEVDAGDWTPGERSRIIELVASKYSQSKWNCKR